MLLRGLGCLTPQRARVGMYRHAHTRTPVVAVVESRSTRTGVEANATALVDRTPSLAGIVDTHCHMDMVLGRFDLGVESFPEWRAGLPKEQNFEACLTIGCSTDAFSPTASMLTFDGVYGAFGIHPLSAHEWTPSVRDQILQLQKLPSTVAVGECGLDYHYETSTDMQKLQKGVFVDQMKMATDLGKPLIVHTREAEEDTLSLMREHLPRDTRVHVHCFTSSAWLAQSLLEEFPNLKIGFTGVITFKNAAEVREVVKRIPLDKILLETDGPYMAPVPHRGKPAHPGYIRDIASAVAMVKGVEVSEVISVVRANTKSVYGI